MVCVLFIDDDPQAHKTLAHVLPDPYTLLSAYTARQGIAAASREDPDLVLLDINLPDMDGIAALRRIVALPDAPPVIMLTAMREPRLVKEAILAGACDYLAKPYELKELLGILRIAVAGADARRAAFAAVPEVPGGLVGESAGMREVRRLILRYAPSDSPVLILGESGTGKELVARSIHETSRRRGAPCIAINCGALPETLLETELFGAEKGAFTDAVARPGSFEQANGGTLFLDEIGEMAPTAQTRLLRVIEQREVTRVGGVRPVALDVRVVSATNRDLTPKDPGKGFRADLFYRLSVLPIRIPPLRERTEDIPLLAAHFLVRPGEPPWTLDNEAREILCGHVWPGNIRELRNVMERAALCAENRTIRPRDLIFDT
jgi:two-component system, NtrC family, response regulator AtoC